MGNMTATATKTITNTKLAVATALAVLAAGAAFIVTPSVDYSGCVDSDASVTFDQNQLFTAASTKYNSGTKMDSCYTFSNGKTYLMEGICSNGHYQTWQKNCAELNLKPGNNFVCQAGACINMGSTTTIPFQPPTSTAFVSSTGMTPTSSAWSPTSTYYTPTSTANKPPTSTYFIPTSTPTSTGKK